MKRVMANNLTSIAKQLRKNSTDAENLLWMRLQRKQVEGLKFRRQEPIGNYIVDFVCFECKVVVEVDGGQHVDDKDRDRHRDERLGVDGFKVLRFWNHEVLQNIDAVLEVIRDNCVNHPPLTPPIKGGE